MNKTVSILLLLLFSMVPLLAEPCGDVNSNMVIDIVDALMTAQYYVGLDPQPYDVDAADVSGDGNINIVDALQTAQYYVGLITELQGCLPGPTSPPVPTPIPDPDAPPGYSWCANEGDSVTFDYPVDVAYGGNGSFNYQYGVTGTITFDNDTFGDPIYGVEKKGYFAPAGPTPTPTPTPTPIPPGWTPPAKGYININDQVPGWASMSGGTTGGGTNLSSAVTVSSMSDLKSEASGSGSKIILVKPGTYNGSFEPGANKTIIGTAPGVTIQGRINISGSNKNNIIVRNIAVRGNSCSSNDDCRSGDDAVYIGNGAHHVWFDHCDVADGQDGNFDITKEGDYITISWTKLWYTKEKPHAQCSLIAGSDGETQSRGKLQITYMNCWWGSYINARQPRGRFGKIHCLNNYHNSQGGIHGVGKEMSLIAENNYYDTPGKSIFSDMGSPTGWKGIGNEGSAKGMSDSRGSVFTIPYNYTAMPASQVKAAVTASVGGAGNTASLQM